MSSDRIDWREDALCAQPMKEQVKAAGVFATPDDFFHIDITRRIGRVHLDRLRMICNACPVKTDCLEYALTEEPDAWGVLGGLTPGEQGKAKGAAA